MNVSSLWIFLPSVSIPVVVDLVCKKIKAENGIYLFRVGSFKEVFIYWEKVYWLKYGQESENIPVSPLLHTGSEYSKNYANYEGELWLGPKLSEIVDGNKARVTMLVREESISVGEIFFESLSATLSKRVRLILIGFD